MNHIESGSIYRMRLPVVVLSARVNPSDTAEQVSSGTRKTDAESDEHGLFRLLQRRLGNLTVAGVLHDPLFGRGGQNGGPWVWVLQKTELGRVYPLMALAFVLVPIGSYLVFGERFPPQYFVGVALIVLGIAIAVGG